MVDKLPRWLFKQPSPLPPPTEDPFSKLPWLEPDQNPFGIRVLDCRGFCRGMLATTGDPQIAAKFLELRHSNGEQHKGMSQPNPLEMPCDFHYASHGGPQDGRLFAAQEMEDKWDIFLFDGHLYFARSWTGNLTFRARVAFTESEAIVAQVEADPASARGDALYTVRQVDFLIKSHLFGKEVPHPLPTDLPDDPKSIALFSFSLYGRWAAFATFEDTLPIRI